MKVLLYQVGKTKISYIEQGINDYAKRISKYIPFKIITLPDMKYSKNQSVEILKIRESENIKTKLKNTDYVILLDERGNQYNSVDFSRFIQDKLSCSKQQLVFIIGGAYGFSEELYQYSDEKISISKMTFSHQLFRLIFLEQLFRAFTILNGEPYHH